MGLGTRQLYVRPKVVKGGESNWREEGQHHALRQGASGAAVGIAIALVCWAWLPGGHGRGPPLPNFAYPRALGLDGFDVQAVLYGLAGAAGLSALLRAPAAGLGAGLIVPILLEQRSTEVHIIALLLGDVSIWAMHCFHMFPERAGVCVPLGAAWDLADVGFLGREAGSVMDDKLRMGALPVLLKLCQFLQ